MKGKSIVIRADASAEIGTGHVMRMIALGQAWQDAGGEVALVSRSPEALLRRCEDSGFKTLRLEGSYPASDGDLPLLLETARAAGAEWIAADNYFYDLAYQRAVRSAGFKLLLVDDYKHQPEYEADVLLNQNAGAETLSYKLNASCKALLGAKYALLRREFRDVAPPVRDYSRGARRILISFGGADPDNASLLAMEALERCASDGVEALVLAGAANVHKESLAKFIGNARTPFTLLSDVKDMPGLLRSVDFAITAGGSTCWELARLGVPMMIASIAENQDRLSEELASRRAALFAGRAAKASLSSWADALASVLKDRPLLESLSSNGPKMIDARGSLRAICAMLSGSLRLRPMAFSDAAKILAWRNSPETRSSSFDGKEISLEEHLRWLERKLSDPQSDLLMAELGPFEAGVLRYDSAGQGAEISVYLNPLWIGSGLGSKLIAAGSRFLFSRRPLAKFIEAAILPENLASQRSFASAGFKMRPDGRWLLERDGA